jgi:hypothetical protein
VKIHDDAARQQRQALPESWRTRHVDLASGPDDVRSVVSFDDELENSVHGAVLLGSPLQEVTPLPE